MKKGTEGYRFQVSNKMDDNSYVSLDKEDNLSYTTNEVGSFMSWLPETLNYKGSPYSVEADEWLSEKLKNNPVHTLTLVFNKDMLLPSYTETIDSFITAVNKVGLDKVVDQADLGSDFVSNFNNVESQDCIDQAYLEFSRSLFRDTDAKKEFIEDLTKKGYDAVVDEADVDFRGPDDFYGLNSSIIVFSKNDTTVSKDMKISDVDRSFFKEVNGGGDEWTMGREAAYSIESELDSLEKYGGSKEMIEVGKKWANYYLN